MTKICQSELDLLAIDDKGPVRQYVDFFQREVSTRWYGVRHVPFV